LSKKIKRALQTKYFSENIIANIIGETLKHSRNPYEILNKLMYYFEIYQNLTFYSSSNIKTLLDRKLSPSTFSILNMKYLEDILKFKILKKGISREEYNKLKDTLRRPILQENSKYFSYIPLECNEGSQFCNKVNAKLQKVLTNCKINEIINSSEELSNPIDCEYLLSTNCIYAHNQLEIDYHPLNYKTSFCLNQQLCISQANCTLAHNEQELILLFNREVFSSVLIDLQSLCDPGNNVQGLLYNHFLAKSYQDSAASDLEENIHLIKTSPCKKKSLCEDIKSCFYYHSQLERRRDPANYVNSDNSICEQVFILDKWQDPSKCTKV
jgi:hypothetical protein